MKIVAISTSILAAIIILSTFIKVDTPPSKDTRIILEHTHETYIAPPCFEQSNATNFLEESTISYAEEIAYPMHDTCTENALEAENNSLPVHLFKQMGLLQKKSDAW